MSQKESECKVKCTCPSCPESPIKRVWTDDEINKVKYCPKHGSTKESEWEKKWNDGVRPCAWDEVADFITAIVSNREKEIAEEVRNKINSACGLGGWKHLDDIISDIILRH